MNASEQAERCLTARCNVGQVAGHGKTLCGRLCTIMVNSGGGHDIKVDSNSTVNVKLSHAPLSGRSMRMQGQCSRFEEGLSLGLKAC